MESPQNFHAKPGPWISLWVVALLSFVAQLALCQFFTLGNMVPLSIDVNPSNLWKYAYHFPPTGSFLVLNWLGQAYLPLPLNPFSAAANLPPELFFSAYTPFVGLCSLLAMAIFLRELELPRPAALFGGVVYAWQGDLLPFVYPGHFAYITTWPFFALAAWGALRADRLRNWAYALISGASCGLMVGMQPDRGAIASLLIAVLFLAPLLRPGTAAGPVLRHLGLCIGAALLIALAPLLALFQSNIVGVKIGGENDREKTYNLVTQYSLGPDETLTYLVPGFFGWHVNNPEAIYWGWIGEAQNWPKDHQGERNSNLAISSTGTVATVLALIGALLLVSGPTGGLLGPVDISPRQRLYGRILLALGTVTLVLAWGWHTPFYRPLFGLPLMDKWRNPLKWLEMTNFAIPALAAFGVRHIIQSLEPGAATLRRGLFWFTVTVLAALVLLFVVSYPFGVVLRSVLLNEGFGAIPAQDASGQPEYDYSIVNNIVKTLHVSVFFAVTLMTLFCLVLTSLWNPEKPRSWKLVNPFLDRVRTAALQTENMPLTLTVLLSALVMLQMGWVAGKFLQPGRLDVLTESNALVEALRSEGNQVRVSVATQDMALNVLLQNQFAEYHISSLEISAASRVPDELQAFFEAFGQDRGRLWFLTGVKNVAVPEEFVSQLQHDPLVGPNIDHGDGYVLVQPSAPNLPSHALVGMRDYMAKATFVPGAQIFKSEDDVLQYLTNPKWNPRATVLLTADESRGIPPTPPENALQQPPQVNLKVYTESEIDVELWTAQPGFLLINDQYDLDWRVLVNGEEADQIKADGILRAVQVPSGFSSVSMRYASRYHYGDILHQLTGINMGDASISAEWLNNFCDAAMLLAWLVAGVALRQRKDENSTAQRS